MHAQLQRVKVESIVFSDDNLAVEDTARRQRRAQWVDQVGKVAIEWLLVAALDQDFIPIAKHKCPKPVPFRFKNPVVPIRQCSDTLGEHRQDRRIHGKVHAPWYTQILFCAWAVRLVMESRLAGNDLRSWHRLWADYGQPEAIPARSPDGGNVFLISSNSVGIFRVAEPAYSCRRATIGSTCMLFS